MKTSLFFLFIAAVISCNSSAFAAKVGQDRILRNDDGSILYLSHSSALKACPQGTHLPSAREMLSLYKADGTKILEPREANEEWKSRKNSGDFSNFYCYDAKNIDGARDRFCVVYDGLKSQDGALAGNFWTSSIRWDHPDLAALGFNGHFYSALENFSLSHMTAAVLCLPNL